HFAHVTATTDTYTLSLHDALPICSMAQANESLRVAQARFSAGAGARLDVLQAEVAVASAEQALVQAQTGVRNAQANLNALINLRSEEHTSELQSRFDLVCRLLLEK